MQLSKDASEFIQLLNTRNVEYLIVGAWALALYARPRYTKDIDIAVAVSEQNARKMLEVLKDFGFSS